MQDSNSFYSLDEAARILKLTPGRIRQMLRAGELASNALVSGWLSCIFVGGGCARWRTPSRSGTCPSPRPPVLVTCAGRLPETRKINPAVECRFVVQALMGSPPGTLHGNSGR